MNDVYFDDVADRRLVTRRGRSVAAGVAVLAMVAPFSVITATPASALGGECSASKQTRVESGSLDSNRARASCISIQNDTKVRAQLDKTLGEDKFSPWFTTTFTGNYTAWTTCAAGCSATYQIDYR